MPKLIVLIFALAFISACSDSEEELGDPNAFLGGLVTDEMKALISSETLVNINDNDSATTKLDLNLQIMESDLRHKELATEYCNSLPYTSEIEQCIETIGTTTLTEELEELSEPILASSITTAELSGPLERGSSNCDYVYLSTRPWTKAKNYIAWTKYQMWIETKAFLGSKTNIDACGRRPIRITWIEQVGKAFENDCDYKGCFANPSPIYVNATRAQGVSYLLSYNERTRTWPRNPYTNCKMVQVKARSEYYPLKFLGNGYTEIKWNVLSNGCKGDYSDFTWW